MVTELKALSQKFAFEKAIKPASTPNDLLPDRLEDKVSGELGKQYIEAIKNQIAEERYAPEKAEFISVPKPGYTTRPAALLKLSDRLIYECLVGSIRKKLEDEMISDDFVMWPRAEYIDKKWGPFERAPIDTSDAYIVSIDITAFYDSIDHNKLEESIVALTGERQIAKCIKSFLGKIMGNTRGVPQGLLPSDTLATLYLQSLDSTMLRHDFNYWRHGDDVRMTADSMSRARECISIAEKALREIGLILNASKCYIRKKENYESHLAEVSNEYRLIKEKLQEEMMGEAFECSSTLQELMDEAQLDDQLKWDLFYHETISVEEIIEKLAEQLKPDDTEINLELYRKTISRMPGSSDPMAEDLFHVQLKKSILRLAAAKDTSAIVNCSELIAKFPEKTDIICSYLKSVSNTAAADVISQVEDLLNSDIYLTSWQLIWLYRVMDKTDCSLSKETIKEVKRNMLDQTAHCIEQVEAMKLLASKKELDISSISKAWNLVPKVYRADLIGAASSLATDCTKAKRFLEGTKQYPIEKVIARHFARDRK